MSVVAEVDVRLIANSEATRGSFNDLHDHSHLGIVVSREYRSIGISTEMIRTPLATKEGLRTVELQVLMTNPRAVALCERLGFHRARTIKKKVQRGYHRCHVHVDRGRTSMEHRKGLEFLSIVLRGEGLFA